MTEGDRQQNVIDSRRVTDRQRVKATIWAVARKEHDGLNEVNQSNADSI